MATPLAVGFGEACEVAGREMQADHDHVNALARRLYEGIRSRVDGVHINGPDLGPNR